MRKSAPPTATSVPSNPTLTKTKRLSLPQQNEKISGSISSIRRNTIQVDHSNSPKTRKKPNKTVNLLQPTIAEDEVVDSVVIRQPQKSIEVASFTIEEEKSSKVQNGKAEEVANIRLSRSSSVNNSINSSASKHGGSVQSLEVVREQYCCLQRKTKLERILFVVVFVLSIIVMALIVVIIVLAKNNGLDSLKDIMN